MFTRFLAMVFALLVLGGNAAHAQITNGHREYVTSLGSYEDPRFLLLIAHPAFQTLREQYLEELRRVRGYECPAITDWELIPTSSGIEDNPYLFVPGGTPETDLTISDNGVTPERLNFLETYRVNFCGEISIERAMWFGPFQERPMTVTWFPGGESNMASGNGLIAVATASLIAQTRARQEAVGSCQVNFDPRVHVLEVTTEVPLQSDGSWFERWEVNMCDVDIWLQVGQQRVGNGYAWRIGLHPELMEGVAPSQPRSGGMSSIFGGLASSGRLTPQPQTQPHGDKAPDASSGTTLAPNSSVRPGAGSRLTPAPSRRTTPAPTPAPSPSEPESDDASSSDSPLYDYLEEEDMFD